LLAGETPEGCERSFKMAELSLLPNRYLVGISARSLAPARLLGLCASIGMPAAHRAEMQQNLPRATTIHFGFEESAASGIYKVYLEFADSLSGASSEIPVLLHRAYKWDVTDNAKCTVASYLCHPPSGSDALLEKLGGIPGFGTSPSHRAASEIVRIAAQRTRMPFMYLEVREEGNPRLSFDLNLHEAALRMVDIEPVVERASGEYRIREQAIAAVFQPLRDAKVAHISGGRDRSGRDFLTLYYPSERP
jgi:hypothetical protein